MPEVFKNAPITEAMLDIQATFDGAMNIGALETFAAQIRDEFPHKQDRKIATAAIRIEAEGQSSAGVETSHQGFVLFSKNRERAIQARLDGFSYSKLPPYQDWASMQREAKTMWELYRDRLQPSKITRIALRYINRINIPIPFADFREYIRTGPDIAPGIPQGLVSFFFSATVPHSDNGSIANIISTMEKPSDTHVPVILDIDVFLNREYESADARLWKDFEALREYKDKIFFSSITENARELFR